jgi:hypothetical protein
MEFDTSLWDEIEDSSGEIFDLEEWVDAVIAADPEITAEVGLSNAIFDAEVETLRRAET